eukprot:4075402-Pleurochrysis_carterae.AAC.1
MRMRTWALAQPACLCPCACACTSVGTTLVAGSVPAYERAYVPTALPCPMDTFFWHGSDLPLNSLLYSNLSHRSPSSLHATGHTRVQMRAFTYCMHVRVTTSPLSHARHRSEHAHLTLAALLTRPCGYSSPHHHRRPLPVALELAHAN